MSRVIVCSALVVLVVCLVWAGLGSDPAGAPAASAAGTVERSGEEAGGRFGVAVPRSERLATIADQAPVEDQAPRTLRLGANPQATLPGRLVDAAGLPVADAELHWLGREGQAWEAVGRSDAVGAFALPARCGVQSGCLAVSHPAHPPYRLSPSALPGRAEFAAALDPLRLPAGWLLRGRLVDGQGAAVRGGEVFASRFVEAVEVLREDDLGPRIVLVEGRGDERGEFELAVPERFAHVAVAAPGFARRWLVDRAPRRSGGAGSRPVLDFGELRMAPERVVEGLVQGPDGAPLGGAWVWLRLVLLPGGVSAPPERSQPRRTRSDQRGWFRFDGLERAAGAWELRARGPGCGELVGQHRWDEENPEALVIRLQADSGR